MSDGRDDFRLTNPMMFDILQVVLQGSIRDSLSHESCHSQEAPGFQVKVLVVPVFTEKNVIIIVGKFRCEVPQLITTSSLYDFFLLFSNISFSYFPGWAWT